ncbi:MAG TPA: signal peptidase I [Chloroflexia bacterium]|nr:signal peptidase I [Chloroflexia bacterium]
MKLEDEIAPQPQQPTPEAATSPSFPPPADVQAPVTGPAEAVASEGATVEEVSPEQSPENAKKRPRSITRDLIETALIVLVVFFVVRSIIQNYQVDGDSMLPTLHNEEYLLVNKAPYFVYDSNALARIFNSGLPEDIHYPLGGPSRGDIIVFNAPTEPRDFVKRVIGLPGDTVEIRPDPDPIGKPGAPCGDCGVYVNGVRLNEPYVRATPDYRADPIVVPQGDVYVLGDNRRNSEDSHILGPIKISSIVGTAVATYWPASMWGFVSHPSYPELQK